jgi:hypothetical protein
MARCSWTPRQSESGQKARGRATGLGDTSHYRRPSSGGNSRVRGERQPGPHRHNDGAGNHRSPAACSCPAGSAAACQPQRHHAASRAGGAAAAINRNKWRQPDHSRPRSAGLRCLDRQSRDPRRRWLFKCVARRRVGPGPLRHSPGAARNSCCSLSLCRAGTLRFRAGADCGRRAMSPLRPPPAPVHKATRLPRESWPRTSAAERPG